MEAIKVVLFLCVLLTAHEQHVQGLEQRSMSVDDPSIPDFVKESLADASRTFLEEFGEEGERPPIIEMPKNPDILDEASVNSSIVVLPEKDWQTPPAAESNPDMPDPGSSGAQKKACNELGTTALISGPLYHVPSAAITASSVFSPKHGAAQGRLNKCEPDAQNACAWVSKVVTSGEYVQADLGKEFMIVKVATQGHGDADTYRQWVTEYKLAFSSDGAKFTEDDNNGLKYAGNVDCTSVVGHVLRAPVKARYVRLIVQEFEERPALRWEVYGCSTDADAPPPKVLIPSLGRSQYVQPPPPGRYAQLCKESCSQEHTSCTLICNTWRTLDDRKFCGFGCTSQAKQCGVRCHYRRPNHHKRRRNRPMTAKMGQAHGRVGRTGGMEGGMGGIMGMGGMGDRDSGARQMVSLVKLIGLPEKGEKSTEIPISDDPIGYPFEQPEDPVVAVQPGDTAVAVQPEVPAIAGQREALESPETELLDLGLIGAEVLPPT